MVKEIKEFYVGPSIQFDLRSLPFTMPSCPKRVLFHKPLAKNRAFCSILGTRKLTQLAKVSQQYLPTTVFFLNLPRFGVSVAGSIGSIS